MSIRFDWYQATIREDLPPSIILERIGRDLPGASSVTHLERGRNGYAKSALLVDREDHTLFTMFHGGNAGAPPNVVASGPDAPAFAHALRSLRYTHDVTRADACCDLEGEDWGSIRDQVQTIARRFRVKGKTDLPDNPEEGATYYAGAPSSAVRCRVYRKDLELIAKGVDPAEFPQPIVRVEPQIRPQGAARRALATKEPEELFGCSQWLRAVSRDVLEGNPSKIVMQTREPTTYEKQVAWLKTQAAKALSAVYSRHPGHEKFGKFIVEEIIGL